MHNELFRQQLYIINLRDAHCLLCLLGIGFQTCLTHVHILDISKLRIISVLVRM